jgi:O-antigen ligase
MMILSTPFSSWRGGSVEHLTMFFKSEWTMLLVMGGLAVTWREVKLLYMTLAASGLLSVAMAKLLLKQTGADGRMELDIPGSSIANSNDMAAHMLLLLPFLLFLMFRPKQNFLIRLLSLAGVLTSIYVTLGSGSRGAMIALGVMGGMLFFQASGIRKILVLLLLPVILIGVFFTLPTGVKNRLFNFDKSYEREGAEGAEAVASLQIRNQLMEHALWYTLQHPLLGIGPGQFPVYDDRASRAEGKRRGSWHNPHIVYLQISSECGIPALLFYLGAIGGSLMGSWRIWKQTGLYPQLSELRVAAQTLTLTALSFYTAILFLPIAYKMYLPALSGLAISMIFVAQKELAQIRKQAANPASGVAAALPAFEPLLQPSLPLRRSTPKLTR